MKLDREISVELTSDGSNTLYVPSLKEHYHSVNGAIQESKHVFIEAGFLKLQKNNINVLEIGFGTGLNAYLTYLEAKQGDKKIDYIGIELFPLSLEIIRKLNYPIKESSIDKHLYEKMHESEWNQRVYISDFFSLTKLEVDFTQLSLSFKDKFDLVYFDAFAPDKQEEMWSLDIFGFIYNSMEIGGVLTTYCAKGVVRRMLQQVGFFVERIPGPPGKREMLRATRLE